MTRKLAVLISGEGSNLGALYRSGIEIAVVVGDQPCTGLNKARNFGLVRERVVCHNPKVVDVEYSRRLMYVLYNMYQIEVVVMAGFKTQLAPVFFEHYRNRVLDIHPSHLPAFKGRNPVLQTLQANPRPAVTGSTVYLAGPIPHEGRILAKSSVPVYASDTEVPLTNRIKDAEHKLYPAAVKGYLMELEQMSAA